MSPTLTSLIYPHSPSSSRRSSPRSVGSLFGLHLSLVLTNNTTIDMGRKVLTIRPAVAGFNLGTRRANFAAIFGRDRRKWFVPVWTSIGDGEEYEVRFKDDGGEAGVIDIWSGPQAPPVQLSATTDAGPARDHSDDDDSDSGDDHRTSSNTKRKSETQVPLIR